LIKKRAAWWAQGCSKAVGSRVNIGLWAPCCTRGSALHCIALYRDITLFSRAHYN
jgi:hypothetical protein